MPGPTSPSNPFNVQRKLAQQKLARRTLLRGSGVAMGIPMLGAMQPAMAAGEVTKSPKRFVAVTLGLGLVAKNLFPEKAGLQHGSSRYLKPLDNLKDRMTILSGVSHPGVKGGHRAEASILTATAMGSAGRATNTISIDQLMAKHLGEATRFPSLVLNTSGVSSPSYTESGAMIPPRRSPRTLFDQLFVNDSKVERQRQADRVRQGRSIMDLVGEDARSLGRTLGTEDRGRLEEYFTSVRDLEKRMAEAERWAKLPKPEVDAQRPTAAIDPKDVIGRFRTMCDLIKLALQTDSTRVVTLHIPGGGGVLPIQGVEQGYHSLSHHGLDESKLAQLALIEGAIVNQWGKFLTSLDGVQENDSTLLDRTSNLMTSNLGNASNHDNRNLPVLVGGGGFRHAGHLAFDRQNNYPLPNLFVSILQNMDLGIDQFASSTGTMSGLELGT